MAFICGNLLLEHFISVDMMANKTGKDIAWSKCNSLLPFAPCYSVMLTKMAQLYTPRTMRPFLHLCSLA